MALRWGPGPVFTYECVANARRWQLFALRTLAASLPGLGLALIWAAKLEGEPLTIHNLASAGESFFYALVGIQLALILIAAPAYAAGAICLDKERGTLLYMLATDLSSAEIILGKLGVRILAVLGLVLAAVPVLFGAIMLGGIEPAAALGAILVCFGVGVSTSTLALTLSVWMRKTYEVLLLVYLLVALLLLFEPMWTALHFVGGIPRPPAGLTLINPFILAFLPYLRPGTSYLSDQAVFLAASLIVSALLCLVAIWHVRGVALSQAGRIQRRRYRVSLWIILLRDLPGPSLDGNPVLWREWFRKRPSRWGLLVWMLYGGVAFLFTLLAVFENVRGDFMRGLSAIVNALQVPVGLLLLSVASVTALVEERVRGSLDVLRTTPLSTFSILWGKWWGAYRPIFFVALLAGLVAASAASKSGRWWGVLLIVGSVLAYGAVLTSLGLALATWISRPSRAHVLNVILLVLITVVPFLPLVFHDIPDLELVALASPFFGMGEMTIRLIENPFHSRRYEEGLIWGCVWFVVYIGAAVALFLFALTTFDLCLAGSRRK